MHAHFLGFECQIPWGPNSAPPMEPRCGTLAAWLLLAGTSPQPPRALPVHRIMADPAAPLVNNVG